MLPHCEFLAPINSLSPGLVPCAAMNPDDKPAHVRALPFAPQQHPPLPPPKMQTRPGREQPQQEQQQQQQQLLHSSPRRPVLRDISNSRSPKSVSPAAAMAHLAARQPAAFPLQANPFEVLSVEGPQVWCGRMPAGLLAGGCDWRCAVGWGCRAQCSCHALMPAGSLPSLLAAERCRPAPLFPSCTPPFARCREMPRAAPRALPMSRQQAETAREVMPRRCGAAECLVGFWSGAVTGAVLLAGVAGHNAAAMP